MSEDPRVLKAVENLKKPRRVYAVISNKGGVGKTTVTTLLALYSAKLGYSTGLLDLDLVNPSTHVVLGLRPEHLKYSEHHGVLPLRIGNLHYFTVVAYTGDRPMALRGRAARDALWEVLSTVNWGVLDVVFVDTPPGIGDEHLELAYKLRGVIRPIVVSTPNPLSMSVVKKVIHILRECGYADLYFVENMGDGKLVDYAKELGVTYLGYIPHSTRLETATGSLDKLLGLDVEDSARYILSKLLPR
ncbi:MAG: P-loop NTPase [Desulfurococcaceae archaeon]